MAEDYWNECYDRVARQKMSPDDFASSFCAACRNPECERTGFRQDNPWFFRILTQKERLLDNPNFADPRDPAFNDVRESLEFQSMVRQALKLQIADDRGDWSIPTEAEVDKLAQQAGLIDPKPAADLIDEITQSPAPEDPLPVSPPKAAPQPEASLAPPPPTTAPRHFVREEQAAPQPAPQPVKKAPPQQVAPPTPTPRNPNVKVGPERLTPTTPTALNTTMPSGGIMLGGVENQAPPPKPHDPWALPAEDKGDKVIEVGGKFVLGGKKEK